MILNMSLAGWIIKDGNYRDMRVGEIHRFALEFFMAGELVESSLDSKILAPVGMYEYDGNGQVVFANTSWWAVDFGVPAYYEQRPPAFAQVGTFVRGRVGLGVDPFMYFESLSKTNGAPDLYRRWKIQRIFLDTTPWIEAVQPNGRKWQVRDATRISHTEVPATDAWKHDAGHGDYTLQCELQTG